VGGHSSSRGGPRRRGHAEQRLTGGGSLGRGTPAAFGLGENAQGMEGDEVDAMALTAGFAVARGGGTAVAAELRKQARRGLQWWWRRYAGSPHTRARTAVARGGCVAREAELGATLGLRRAAQQRQ
jgi:hypothetical protein